MPDVCDKYAPIAVPTNYYAPNYGYAPARVAGIEVVNGKTGRVGVCDNYDAPGQKCLKWAGTPSVQRRTATGRPIIMTKKQPAAEKPAEIAVVTP